jgi:hypothetical protein
VKVRKGDIVAYITMDRHDTNRTWTFTMDAIWVPAIVLTAYAVEPGQSQPDLDLGVFVEEHCYSFKDEERKRGYARSETTHYSPEIKLHTWCFREDIWAAMDAEEKGSKPQCQKKAIQ